MKQTPDQIILNETSWTTLPDQPAVYAFFIETVESVEKDSGIYVGSAINLKYSIFNHFYPFEPVLPLRSFLLSDTLKYLRFEIIEIPDHQLMATKQSEWVERLNPLIKV
ncbi:MAG: hypothetical protein WCI71_19515 [Bacteroidota bacterium]